MAYTEFYCDPVSGDPLAAGSTTGAATLSATGGNWNATTGVFTFAGATDLSGISAGMWASVYPDGATAAVFVGRITNVNDGADQVTVSTTIKGGTAPVTSVLNDRSIKIGGAWKGPTNADWNPLGLVAGAMVNSSGDVTRVNFKTGRYTITETAGNVGVINSQAGPIVFEGYTSSPGDGTLAMTLPEITGDIDDDGEADNTPFIGWTIAGTRYELRYLHFSHNGFVDPGPNADGDYMVRTTSGGTSFVTYRCKFSYTWRDGLRTGGAAGLVEECEGNACNRDAANTYGQFNAYASTVYIRCWAHHSYKEGDAGAPGFCFQAGTAALVVYDSCISSHNGGQGFWNVTGAPVVMLKNCIAYQNGLSGIEFANNSTGTATIENCAFIDNGEHGIRYLNTTWAASARNNAFYSNTDGEIGQGIADRVVGSVTLSGDPFVDGVHGDFSLNTTSGAGAACRSAGLARFLVDESTTTAVAAAYDEAVTDANISIGALIPLVSGGSVSMGGAGTVSFVDPD